MIVTITLFLSVTAWAQNNVQSFPSAENAYWFARQGTQQTIPNALLKYRGAWPCQWGERLLQHDAVTFDVSYRICGVHLLQSPCIVYSFGSNNDFDFEDAIKNIAPHCKTYTFDPGGTHYENRVVRKLALSNFSGSDNIFLKADHATATNVETTTLRDIMTILGHDHIDVLKLDIEGSEFRVIDELAKVGFPSISQILLEVHTGSAFGNYTTNDIDTLIEQLENNGFRLFASEPNHAWGKDCCIVMSFIQSLFNPTVKNYPLLRHETSLSYSAETVGVYFVPDGHSGNTQSAVRLDVTNTITLPNTLQGLLVWEVINNGRKMYTARCCRPHGSIDLPWSVPTNDIDVGKKAVFTTPISTNIFAHSPLTFTLGQIETNLLFGDAVTVHVRVGTD